jgi:hypothetical protein
MRLLCEVDASPSAIDLDAHVGDLLLDGVQAGDGLSERLALLRVPVGVEDDSSDAGVRRGQII